MNDNEFMNEEDDELEDSCGGGCASCAGCGGDGSGEPFVYTPTTQQVILEYIYIDANGCKQGVETKALLEESLNEFRPVLEMIGIKLEYHAILVDSAQIALQYQLKITPTIRVNGSDLFVPTCNENCTDEELCRSWEIDGERYDVLPKPLLTNNILAKIFDVSNVPAREPVDFIQADDSYVMPAKFVRFFTRRMK